MHPVDAAAMLTALVSAPAAGSTALAAPSARPIETSAPAAATTASAAAPTTTPTEPSTTNAPTQKKEEGKNDHDDDTKTGATDMANVDDRQEATAGEWAN